MSNIKKIMSTEIEHFTDVIFNKYNFLLLNNQEKENLVKSFNKSK